MLEKVPSQEELASMLGMDSYKNWQAICAYIEEQYDMEAVWYPGGKAGLYECKFRRGGRTMCSLFPRDGGFSLMVVYGRAEREKFEARRQEFSVGIQRLYDEAQTYHDGKWIMIDVTDSDLIRELQSMIAIKRKPNRKLSAPSAG